MSIHKSFEENIKNTSESSSFKQNSQYSPPLPPPNDLTSVQRNALDFMARHRTPNKDEGIKRQPLPQRIKFSEKLEDFEVYKALFEGHFIQTGMSYLFQTSFQEAYLTFGKECINYIRDPLIPSQDMLLKDIRVLYGALKQSCTNGAGKVILLKYEQTQDGLRAWKEMLEKYDREGDDQARIATLEAVIQVAYTPNYKGGFTKFVDDYEAAFAELNIIDKDNWQTDNAKKRRLYENGLPPAMYWV